MEIFVVGIVAFVIGFILGHVSRDTTRREVRKKFQPKAKIVEKKNASIVDAGDPLDIDLGDE